MGIGLGGLLKLAKGGLGPEELAEVLGAAGIEVAFRPLDKTDSQALAPFAEAVSLPGSKVMELKGKTKDGGQVYALLVMNQAGN